MAISDAQRTILREIDRISGPKKTTSSNVLIRCPFHADNNPSCGIYVVPNGKVPFGYFSCMGCGAKGSWNTLAQKLGLQTVTKAEERISETSTHDLERKRRSMLGQSMVEMPLGIPFDDEQWRKIPGKLLRDIGVVISMDKREKIAALFIPIRVKNELLTVIKARLKTRKGSASYILMSEEGVKERGLFPFDVVERLLQSGQYKYLTIVEGPRDALYLISQGIPAIAILGTQMYSSTKRSLILELCNKYDVLPLVMMDGDRLKNGVRAGQEAQKRIVEDLEGFIEVSQIKLWSHAKRLGLEELDPATLPRSMIRRIKEFVKH